MNTGVQFDKVYIVLITKTSYAGGASGDFYLYMEALSTRRMEGALDGKYYHDCIR